MYLQLQRPLGITCHGKPCEPMPRNSAQADEGLRPAVANEFGNPKSQQRGTKGQSEKGEGMRGKRQTTSTKHSRLGLRHVDDGAAHAADEDHAALCLALHEVAGDGGGEEVGAVDVDGEQLAHALDGVVGCVVVLGEARGRDQVVDLAVLREDVGDAGADRFRVRHVGVVGGDLGGPAAGVSRDGIYIAGCRIDRVGTHFFALGLSFLN